jgi:hypothetical protein
MDHGDYVSVGGAGYWSPAYVDEHFTKLEPLIERVRRRGKVRVLVDLTHTNAQPAETAERIRYWTLRLYGEQDRVAIVVASSQVKAQMRRLEFVSQRALFLSRGAAITWLLAQNE